MIATCDLSPEPRPSRTPVSQLPLLTDGEGAEIAGWNATECAVSGAKRSTDVLGARAPGPVRIALAAGDTRMTYGELESAREPPGGTGFARSESVAAAWSVLHGARYRPIVGMLGILKAGGASCRCFPTSHRAPRGAAREQRCGVVVTRDELPRANPRCAPRDGLPRSRFGRAGCAARVGAGRRRRMRTPRLRAVHSDRRRAKGVAVSHDKTSSTILGRR